MVENLFSGKNGSKIKSMIDGMFDHLFGYKEMKESNVEVVKLEYDYLIYTVVAYIASVILNYYRDMGRINVLELDAIELINKRIMQIDEIGASLKMPIYKGYRIDYDTSLPSVLEQYRQKLLYSKNRLTYEAKCLEGSKHALRLLVLRASYGLLHGRVTMDNAIRGAKFASLIADRMGLEAVEVTTMKNWIMAHVDNRDNDNNVGIELMENAIIGMYDGYDIGHMGLVKVDKKEPDEGFFEGCENE